MTRTAPVAWPGPFPLPGRSSGEETGVPTPNQRDMGGRAGLWASLVATVLSVAVAPAGPSGMKVYLASTGTARLPQFITGSTISGDGRFVAFISSEGLAPTDVDGDPDVYVRDLRTNAISLGSGDSKGRSEAGAAWSPALSHDGRFVAFSSNAVDLDRRDSRDRDLDVYLHDRKTKQTLVISEHQLVPAYADRPAISGDGSTIAFVGAVPVKLDNGESWSREDVFVYDVRRRTLTALRPLARTTGRPYGGWVESTVSLSKDGRYVAFSHPDPFVRSDANKVPDVYVHDRRTGGFELISVAGRATRSARESALPSISYDGRLVAFASAAPLAKEAVRSEINVYVRDRKTRTTRLVSRTPDGRQGESWSFDPKISGSGRRVVFVSTADDLSSMDSGCDARGCWRIMAFDIPTRRMRLVSRTGMQTESLGHSGLPAISADGDRVVFVTDMPGIDPADRNLDYDTFVADGVWRYPCRQRATEGSSGSVEYAAAAMLPVGGREVHEVLCEAPDP